ncbi:hypothetical protein HAX54_040765 [Datura stramonium]|uniref:KIB1-4 beta-propeller domain-containing protein n=1 Tax=Datura stramonium TaxID=4076 RepID=A0ABS8RNE1_DATST|nr:hypothetical protein [Datura stramonium]
MLWFFSWLAGFSTALSRVVSSFSILSPVRPSICLTKITLSKNPSTNPHDFEVAAICKNKSGAGEKLAILKPGGKILSADYTGVRSETAPRSKLNSEFYTITNELLKVERSNPFDQQSSSVKICKLVTCGTTEQSMFVDVDNLGDETSFVCHYGATSVSGSKFWGCKSNSIYYVDRFCTELDFCDLSYVVENIYVQDQS